jgi:quercetin dioxygenase-like cupin family protein
MSACLPIVRAEGEGERRWFSGGGFHVWKATAAETDGAFFLFEDQLTEGKSTPLHCHPEADEIVYVIDGEIVLQVDGADHRVGRGGVAVSPRGVPHAFRVVSGDARLLVLHTPGGAEAFFRDASDTSREGDGPGAVDIPRVQASAQRNGGTQILGPPPFAQH